MPFLLIQLNRGRPIAADCGKYGYVALELVGDELDGIQLHLHGTRMVGPREMEYASWDDQKVHVKSYVSVRLVEGIEGTEPATTSVSEISVEAIQRDLDDLAGQLGRIRRPSKPHVRQATGALKLIIATPKFPELSFSTANEQYLQIRGVWSGESNVFAIDGRSFDADKNGQPHSFRKWFVDELRVGDGARFDIESAARKSI